MLLLCVKKTQANSGMSDITALTDGVYEYESEPGGVPPPAEKGMNFSHNEVCMQIQFLLMGLRWLPQALAMEEFERLMSQFDTNCQAKILAQLDVAYSDYLHCRARGEGDTTKKHVVASKKLQALSEDEAQHCVRYMTAHFGLCTFLCGAYVCSKYNKLSYS